MVSVGMVPCPLGSNPSIQQTRASLFYLPSFRPQTLLAVLVTTRLTPFRNRPAWASMGAKAPDSTSFVRAKAVRAMVPVVGGGVGLVCVCVYVSGEREGQVGFSWGGRGRVGAKKGLAGSQSSLSTYPTLPYLPYPTSLSYISTYHKGQWPPRSRH